MHVTMARISHELAQWQSERAAQDDKIDTPARQTVLDRCRSSDARSRSLPLDYQYSVDSRAVFLVAIRHSPLCYHAFQIAAFDGGIEAIALRVSTTQSAQSASSLIVHRTMIRRYQDHSRNSGDSPDST